MILPLTIAVAIQSSGGMEKEFAKCSAEYDHFLQRLVVVFDPLYRVNERISGQCESIASRTVKSPIQLKALTLALLSSKPNLARETKLLNQISALKATSGDQIQFMLKWGNGFVKDSSTFQSHYQLPKVFDPYIAGSKSKATTASLLLLKADTMSDILDIKWDVYNRLVEQYSGTDAAKSAREKILKKKHLQPGDFFPDFVSKDSNGKKFQLTDLRGKVVVLEFWANWCPSCQRTIPVMQRVEKEFAGQPVEFIGINSDGDVPVVKELEAKYNMTHRNLVDGSPAGPISISYNIMAWPSFIVIGKDGKVVFRSAGIDAEGMTAAIREASK
jgi:thiol-disulfide isomerase/thioredoxin